MAKEAEKAEGEQAEVEAPVHPMFNKVGIIVLVVALLLEAGIFGAVLVLMKPPGNFEVSQPVEKDLTVTDLNAPKIKVDPGIVVSVPTNEGGTEVKHLSVGFEITIGRLPNETGKGFNLIEKLAEEQFLDTAQNIVPYIKDAAISVLNEYTYMELRQGSTMTEFSRRLRARVNHLLEEHNLPPRIKDVLITSFIFTD